ncbi:putative phospholipase A-2-activating protein [Naematelia encephala]|uniref:Putative phospholipase A-2-activating protein n=1 Tax=Naematelia encephala TaxID=71784 RepID=A0A1Y2AWM5_9TREE|nr:putative phospholipase A-2-activating protein [Naematelia encephala]
MSAPYQFAFALHGHASDVRNICAPSPEVPLLLSGSRDGSAIVWGPSSRGREWDVKLRVEAPEKRYVSCVGMVRWGGEALLLVGSVSGILSTYALPASTASAPDMGQLEEPLHTLIEHKQNLCCMDTSKGGLVATGSWDKSVIVWKDLKKAIKIQVHEQAVWAVRFVGEDRLLTAAADKKIILHAIDLASGTSHPLQEYTGHTEPVRGLSLKPDGKGFWSCGNDSLVNLYSFDRPAPLQSLSGHTSFVYSVSALPDGTGAISSGEDGTLRVWSETELLQTIAHPSASLWSCATAPSGSGYYIVSSANDSVIRFFTKNPELAAPADEQEKWEKEVSSRQLDKSQVGDVKKSDLPGMEALGREGKKDGQVLMIKNDGQVEAYQWSASQKTWQQIGQVVDAIGQGRKQLYEGQEYDYVFDVDVSEGMPPLKLPFNVTENPWIAAQKFLNRNELPLTYTEQVVDFIEKNTSGVQLGQGATDANAYVDPFTGGARYTGASTSGPSTGGGDPFTGSNAYSTTPAPIKGVLPVKTYLSFKQMNVNAAKAKIAQLNEEVKAASADLALNTDDEKNLSEVFALLSQPTVALPNVNASDASERYDASAVLALMSKWPEDKRFPLIDVARCLAAISPAIGSISSAPQQLLAAAAWDTPWQATKPRETNTLLALRGIANLFLTANGRRTMGGEAAGALLSTLRSGRQWSEVGARKLPLVTIALNYSVLACNNELTISSTGALLDLVVFILDNEKEDAETIYRAGVAFGNLLCSPSVSGSLQVGLVKKGKDLLAASSGKEKRLTDLAGEVGRLGT